MNEETLVILLVKRANLWLAFVERIKKRKIEVRECGMVVKMNE